MELPVVGSRVPESPADLMRLFHRTETRWLGQLGEQTAIEVGTATCNPALGNVHDANNLTDAALPAGMDAEGAIDVVRRHFDARGCRCAFWATNPSAPAERTAPLVQRLIALGHGEERTDIMRLEHAPRAAAGEPPGLTLIPARAAYSHARTINQEGTARHDEPQMVEAAMRRLDDPHFDAVMAMLAGRCVGYAGLLTVGELGRIEEVFVSETFRRRRIARAMMMRLIDLCARSLLRHVFLTVRPDNTPGISLYQSLGFVRIGQYSLYRAP